MTPFKAADGKVTVYADYRDKWKSNRRRIACELVANKQVVLAFDGKPLLDSEAKEPTKEVAAAPPATGLAPEAPAPSVVAAPPRALRRLKHPGLGVAAKADPAAPDVAKPEAPAPEPKPAGADEKKKPLREIRDCRSFVDNDGDVWGLGTELLRRAAGRRLGEVEHAPLRSAERQRWLPLARVGSAAQRAENRCTPGSLPLPRSARTEPSR